ncbi:transposase, mutator-like family protein [Porphyromonas gingivalis W50]|nr:transposase, mutator-like family protein [Porphyromonas gingivalis W50]
MAKMNSWKLYIEKHVISLYVKQMSVSDISDIEDKFCDIYEISLSTSAISIITNKVIQSALEWQNSPLDRRYMVV